MKQAGQGPALNRSNLERVPMQHSIVNTLALRGYQQAAQQAMQHHWQTTGSGSLLVMATGTGKTFTALHRAASIIQKGGRVLWLAHRAELIHQPVRTWTSTPGLATGTVGTCMAATKELGMDLVVASTQTLGRGLVDGTFQLLARYLAHGLPSLVVLDEAHHYADDGDGQFAALVAAIQTAAPDAKWLGLTATPERLDGRSIGRLWGGCAAFSYDYVSAIRDGMLVPPVVEVDQIQLPAEAAEAYELAQQEEDWREAAALLIREGVVAHTVAAMERHRGRRRGLVFCATVAQARATAAALGAEGWEPAVVSANTPRAVREKHLADFQAGWLDVLVNCNVLTEGTDLPCVDLIVAARPFSSKVLWVQAVGRGLRLYPQKESCLVLDLVGASLEHDLAHAAALLERQETAQQDERQSTSGGSLTDWERIRTQARARWLELRSHIWVCDLGRHGAAWLVETAQGWHLYHSRRPDRLLEPPRAMHYGPADVGHAMALGNDLYRQAGAIAQTGAAWRDKPPTAGQRAYLERHELTAATRGAASDLLSLRSARAAVWSWKGPRAAFRVEPGKCRT